MSQLSPWSWAKVHLSVNDLAFKFVEDAQKVTGTQLVSKWQPTAAPSQLPSAATSSASNNIREFLPDGSLKDPSVILVDQGINVGSSVQRKADKLVASVKSFDMPHITLQTASGVIQVPVQAFQDKEWIKFEVKAQPDSIPNWMDHSAHQAKEFHIARVKGMIVDELCELTSKHVKNYEHLELFTKPHKSVIATARVEKGKLVLVPASTKITHGNDGNLLVAEVSSERFWIAPHTSLPGTKSSSPFLAPYWFVQKQADPELVNMEVQAMKVKKDHIGTFTFQVMKNIKTLQPDDVLYVLDKDKAKSSDKDKAKSSPSEQKAKRTKV